LRSTFTGDALAGTAYAGFCIVAEIVRLVFAPFCVGYDAFVVKTAVSWTMVEWFTAS
jgi:hypothetical protein